jgi:hypothetical protein
MTDKIAKYLTDNKPLGRIVGYPDRRPLGIDADFP